MAPGRDVCRFEIFRNFEQDGKNFAQFAETKLTMPMLVLTRRKGLGRIPN